MTVAPDTIKVLEWPVVEPVSLTEARHQVGLMPDQTDHDQILMRAIATARRLIERRLSITLVATRYRATWSSAPSVISLPHPPLLINATYGITVTDNDAAVSAEAYEVNEDAVPATITFTQQPGGKVVVTYWAGVSPETPIEPTLRSLILMFVTHAFDNRGIIADGTAGGELPQAFEMLLAASSWNGAW